MYLIYLCPKHTIFVKGCVDVALNRKSETRMINIVLKAKSATETQNTYFHLQSVW